jgi:alpha-ketoglutarate-dependent taurine dioxygenase
MRSTQSSGSERISLGHISRKPVIQAPNSWVKTELLSGEGKGPFVISAAIEGVDVQQWARDNRALIHNNLLKYGAVLFRNFAVAGTEGFEQFVTDFAGKPLEYKERSSPRHKIRGQVYTSTDYPAHQSIFFHNENSYQHVWPMKIAFYCHTPAETGGETPIADTREVFRLLSPATRQAFDEKGCLYVRNFDGQFGLPWQVVFQTEDRAQVEEYARRADIMCDWLGENHLRTRSVRSAICDHPQTGESLWFNHVAFFHYSTLESSIREGLLAALTEDELPSNSYYGDGQPIEPGVLDEIRQAYRRAAIVFSWRKGDVLLLDNMLMAHSRAPFTGPRKIMVAMADPFGHAVSDVSGKSNS